MNIYTYCALGAFLLLLAHLVGPAKELMRAKAAQLRAEARATLARERLAE